MALLWKGKIFPTCASRTALVPVPSTSSVSVKMDIALTPVFVQEFVALNTCVDEPFTRGRQRDDCLM